MDDKLGVQLFSSLIPANMSPSIPAWWWESCIVWKHSPAWRLHVPKVNSCFPCNQGQNFQIAMSDCKTFSGRSAKIRLVLLSWRSWQRLCERKHVTAGFPVGLEGGQQLDIVQSSVISIAARRKALLFPSQSGAKLRPFSTCVLFRQSLTFLRTAWTFPSLRVSPFL